MQTIVNVNTGETVAIIAKELVTLYLASNPGTKVKDAN